MSSQEHIEVSIFYGVLRTDRTNISKSVANSEVLRLSYLSQLSFASSQMCFLLSNSLCQCSLTLVAQYSHLGMIWGRLKSLDTEATVCISWIVSCGESRPAVVRRLFFKVLPGNSVRWPSVRTAIFFTQLAGRGASNQWRKKHSEPTVYLQN